ncbi:MAG TPA: hypothetical protein VFS00_03005 [Polyangiaceae bacterium]|nr:hypothetical protein [Polyangiaceae bacterium]
MNRIFFAALLPLATMMGCADEADPSTESDGPATEQVEAANAEASQVSEQKPKCTPSISNTGSTICCTPVSCVEF